MSPKIRKRAIGPGEKIFDVGGEPFPKGAWWWWFWLFFFDNPKNPEKPRQLMILWSTKNVKKIDCNDLHIKLRHPIDKKSMDGAVAAWYFDGEKMHHNFLLEQCRIKVDDCSLMTDSHPETVYEINGSKNTVKIGGDMEFVAYAQDTHEFVKPSYHANNFIGSKGYSITKMNYLKLEGKVDGEAISGTAYFQRVFVNAPAVPWYWGGFHFDSGAVLTYTNQFVFGQPIKKHIAFFDGRELFELNDVEVKRVEKENPEFWVSGETDDYRIRFIVSAYSHSSWTFKKRSLGLIPNKLVYNEYPSTITKFEFEDKKSGKKITGGDLGKGIGNAEHTTGYLL